MEIELKYQIPSEEIIKKLWKDEVFESYGDVDPKSSIDMDAIYYDSADGILAGAGAAFRIRREGKRLVATLKWAGTENEGLHEREELNVQLPAASEQTPSLEVFDGCDEGRQLLRLLDGRPLVRTLEMVFRRDRKRLDTGSMICEIALDTGIIQTENGDLVIRELEIELFSGDQEEIRKIGASLMERFGLVAGVRSKYGRGMDLIRGIRMTSGSGVSVEKAGSRA